MYTVITHKEKQKTGVLSNLFPWYLFFPSLEMLQGLVRRDIIAMRLAFFSFFSK